MGEGSEKKRELPKDMNKTLVGFNYIVSKILFLMGME